MRRSLKQTLGVLALALVLPAVLGYKLASLFLGQAKAFPGWSQGMCLFPGLCGVYLRRAFYWCVLPRCGEDCCISFGTVFSHPSVQLGSKVYLGVYCCIGDVTLEDDVLVGSHVSIMNGSRQHGIDSLSVPVREQPGVYPHVTIGRDSWLGDRAIVMADVGEHCVVGAGAVVTKPVPDFAIVAGVPARIVGTRRETTPLSSAASAAATA